MQTFVPYPSPEETARVLDRQRLGKQRVECKQILMALAGDTTGWVNHPATRMWRGHERALCDYAVATCEEWRARGYVDNLQPWFTGTRGRFPSETAASPAWWGRGDVHASHRAQLLRKDHTHYQGALSLTDDEVTALTTAYPGYVWPV